MKHKISDLTGPLLDAAVAMALGGTAKIVLRWPPISDRTRTVCRMDIDGPYDLGGGYFEPSVQWRHGGPIIERERISVRCREPNAMSDSHYWAALVDADKAANYAAQIWHVGPTPMIAAMRAFVAAKLGEEVELPEESA